MLEKLTASMAISLRHPIPTGMAPTKTNEDVDIVATSVMDVLRPEQGLKKSLFGPSS